jgi:hypothetical protein
MAFTFADQATPTETTAQLTNREAVEAAIEIIFQQADKTPLAKRGVDAEFNRLWAIKTGLEDLLAEMED